MTNQLRRSGRSSPGAAQGTFLAVVLGAALTLSPAAVEAQAAADDGAWLPWLGCWTETGTSGELLCVRPSEEDGAVELLSVEEGRVASTEVLRADGRPRPVSREGCEGTRTATFSDDRRRVYLHSDLTCEGDVERRSTGIVAWVSPEAWIRVQTVEVGQETAATIERYRLARSGEVDGTGLADIAAERSLAVSSARMAAASRPSPDAVVETSGEVHEEAVRAWIAERGDPLDVDAGTLAGMSEAGVADEVIDVVVAVSFPDRFAIDRGTPTAADRGAGAESRYGMPYGASDRYGYGYPYRYRSPYRWRSFGAFGYGYSPFGRRSGYGWWYGRRNPTIIVVRPAGETDDGGRLVNGRGFTRDGSDSRGTARRPSSSLIDRPSRGSISPAGAKAGGSSGSTGRKAKKKGGGSSDGGGGSSDGGGSR